MNKLHGIILDETSFNHGDLNLSRLLNQLDGWQRFDATKGSEQMILRLQGANVAVANKAIFSQEVIERSPDLKLVLLTATGTDNVDHSACRAAGITVKNVEDYCTPAVSQHVLSLMLALVTNLTQYQQDARDGTWSNSPAFSVLNHPIGELAGKTLGLVGYGTLAKAVEKLARAFGMTVLIANRPGGVSQSGRLDLDDLLVEADFISLHCPLTEQTRNLIGKREFELMKSTAFIINTARGAIIDTVALAEALKNKTIRGAGIDVLETEPPARDHPLLINDVPNLILTPHIAWASIEARQRLIDKVADNLQQWLNVRTSTT